jgi:hypothetical protein
MKLLLIVGGCICALASLWGAVAICSTWFIVPRDHSMTAAHDILMRLAYTALFIMASAVFGACSLLAFRKTGILHGAGQTAKPVERIWSDCETGHELNAVARKKMKVNASRDC